MSHFYDVKKRLMCRIIFVYHCHRNIKIAEPKRAKNYVNFSIKKHSLPCDRILALTCSDLRSSTDGTKKQKEP